MCLNYLLVGVRIKNMIAKNESIDYLNSEIKRCELDRNMFDANKAISLVNYIDGYMSACYEIIRYTEGGA